jgi:hypothetical protein
MEKEIEVSLKAMSDYYYFLVDRLPSRQDGLFRTYLWLASLAVTLNLLLFQHVIRTIESPPGVLAVTSIVLAGLLLFICLYAMRGKEPLSHPDMQVVLKWLDECNEQSVMRRYADSLWESVTRETKANSSRGLILRATSYGLILSFGFLGAAACIAHFFA